MTQQPHDRFCGIDVAKDKHVACIIDSQGQFVTKRQSFLNTAAGFQQILRQLQQAGGNERVLVGMESTGHYWYPLHDFLTRCGYRVILLNPIQTAERAHRSIRKSKTDRIDAHRIAVLLKNGDYRASCVPGEFCAAARQLTRLRHALVRQSSRTKQLIWSRLHPVWPEYEKLLSDPFGPTGRKLLAAACTPADVLALGEQALTELVRKASRGQIGPEKVQEILAAARDSVGMRYALDAARVGVRTLLSVLDALRPIREELEGRIVVLAGQLPGYVLTLPGAQPLRAVSLHAETDPIARFGSADAFVAFAGLDTVVFQSGNYTAPRRRISKRGSPFLRDTIWSMAHLAIREQGPLRDFYQAKRNAGLHHFSAVTAAAIKLARIIWRVLTDQRDYIADYPAKPVTHTNTNT